MAMFGRMARLPVHFATSDAEEKLEEYKRYDEPCEEVKTRREEKSVLMLQKPRKKKISL